MEIKHSTSRPVAYEDAVAFMEERVRAIREEGAEDMLWFLEHPPLYTAGTSAQAEDLLNPKFPVFKTGRGGQYTYHGPGQRVVYVMTDLKKRQGAPDIRKYVHDLEEWIIQTLNKCGVQGERREGRIGIWVDHAGHEAKIAALGIRVRRWVAFHGISINVDPDLSHFKEIIPCGIREYGVTSLKKLDAPIQNMVSLDRAILDSWPD